MGGYVNLIKLSVGSESVETLIEFQAERRKQFKRDYALHVTRMWPKREAEVVAGGSIYWVIKGFVQARQKFIRFDEKIGEDGIRRCGFVLDPELIRTSNAQRRPFQGWRYLSAEDAPKDLPKERGSEKSLPLEMQNELDNLGLR